MSLPLPSTMFKLCNFLQTRVRTAIARRVLRACLAGCALSVTAAVGAATTATYETRLANGLQVIVKEDHRAPSVVHMVWYHVGSMDESDGNSGLAHALEHMMFKGTKTVPAGGFSRSVAELGGRDNAFTSLDYTAYFQIVPKGALPRVMELEADRMANLKITESEFKPEIQVVMEERRMRTEDNPTAKVYEALNAAAFEVSRYRRPVIGWMIDLQNMGWQDARDWYATWYAPNNATLVVVGDVDHAAVFQQAQKYYGGIKAHPLPQRRPQTEPAQEGIRRVWVKAPAKLPYLVMAWKAPHLTQVNQDRDPYALQVLAAVLDGHEAARLPRRLVRELKVAQTAGADYDPTVRGESLFLLEGQPAAGKSAADLEAALRDEIRRIQQEGVAADELERVKTQLVASETYKRDSMMAQAMEIGGLEAVGLSWRDLDPILEHLRAVSAEDVRAVAQKYFKDDSLTVATLDPQPVSHDAPLTKPSTTLLH